jgi:hypothetical protein
MLSHLHIYIDFDNGAGFRFVASVDNDGNVGLFNEYDHSSGTAHNTNKEWLEATDIFNQVVYFYISETKNLFPFADGDESYIRMEVADEGLCSISLDAPDDAKEKFPNCSIFGEILFEAEEGEAPDQVVFSF